MERPCNCRKKHIPIDLPEIGSKCCSIKQKQLNGKKCGVGGYKKDNCIICGKYKKKYDNECIAACFGQDINKCLPCKNDNCKCKDTVDPVCCNGKQYINQCKANCKNQCHCKKGLCNNGYNGTFYIIHLCILI